MISIVDYGLGNLKAFANIYKRLNIEAEFVKTPEQLNSASKIILPGVGAFDHAMEELNKSGMRVKLDELVLQKKVPVLGIDKLTKCSRLAKASSTKIKGHCFYYVKIAKRASFKRLCSIFSSATTTSSRLDAELIKHQVESMRNQYYNHCRLKGSLELQGGYYFCSC
jgi:hypothetical protein